MEQTDDYKNLLVRAAYANIRLRQEHPLQLAIFTIGSELFLARISHQKSQQDVANAMGVEPHMIECLERGLVYPLEMANYLPRWCRAINEAIDPLEYLKMLGEGYTFIPNALWIEVRNLTAVVFAAIVECLLIILIFRALDAQYSLGQKETRNLMVYTPLIGTFGMLFAWSLDTIARIKGTYEVTVK